MRLPAPALFIVAGLFQYVGAAIATGLFTELTPLAVAWWRIVIGAGAMILIWRPWRQRWSWSSVAVSVVFGLALAGMNLLFYEAIARLPLGVAVSLEFLGPVAVAVFRGRGWLPRVGALIALLGVLLIGGWGLNLTDPQIRAGFYFGLAAGAAWAGYILLGSFVSRSGSPGPSLAVGTSLAAVLLLPLLWSQVSAQTVPAGAGADPWWGLALALLAVGLFSSAIPYSIEAVAFSRLSSATFALLTALLPATSTLVGAVILQQLPSAAELIGLVLISVAVWLASRASERPVAGKEPG